MGLEVANDDLKVGFTLVSGPPDAVPPLVDQSLGGVLIAGASTKCDAPSGKNVRKGSVTATWTALSPCPFTSPIPPTHTFNFGTLSILATATKVKAESVSVLRRTDAGSCNGGWTRIADGVPVSCQCNVVITDAGQTKVKAL